MTIRFKAQNAPVRRRHGSLIVALLLSACLFPLGCIEDVGIGPVGDAALAQNGGTDGNGGTLGGGGTGGGCGTSGVGGTVGSGGTGGVGAHFTDATRRLHPIDFGVDDPVDNPEDFPFGFEPAGERCPPGAADPDTGLEGPPSEDECGPELEGLHCTYRLNPSCAEDDLRIIRGCHEGSWIVLLRGCCDSLCWGRDGGT